MNAFSFLSQPKRSTDTPLPRRLADFPDFAAANARLSELRAERSAIEAKIEESRRRLLDVAEADLDAAAAAIFRGEPKEDVDALKREMASLSRSLEVAWRAEGLARDELARVRNLRSLQLRRQFEPRHRAAVREIARCLRALGQANALEEGIRIELVEAGVLDLEALPTMYFPPGIHRSGILGNSAADTWMTTAQARGFIVPGDDLEAEVGA